MPENVTHFNKALCCVTCSGINKLVRSLFSVAPESIVIPIVSCIFGFPVLALLVICCLRKRAKLARERDRRRNYDLQDHTVSLVRFSPIHRLSEFPCFTAFHHVSDGGRMMSIVGKGTNEQMNLLINLTNTWNMTVDLNTQFPFIPIPLGGSPFSILIKRRNNSFPLSLQSSWTCTAGS